MKQQKNRKEEEKREKKAFSRGYREERKTNPLGILGSSLSSKLVDIVAFLKADGDTGRAHCFFYQKREEDKSQGRMHRTKSSRVYIIYI